MSGCFCVLKEDIPVEWEHHKTCLDHSLHVGGLLIDITVDITETDTYMQHISSAQCCMQRTCSIHATSVQHPCSRNVTVTQHPYMQNVVYVHAAHTSGTCSIHQHTCTCSTHTDSTCSMHRHVHGMRTACTQRYSIHATCMQIHACTQRSTGANTRPCGGGPNQEQTSEKEVRRNRPSSQEEVRWR